jgi:hypothetical protein
MKKILLIALSAAFVCATTTPTLTKLLGFGPATAYAQSDENGQGQDNNDQ